MCTLANIVFPVPGGPWSNRWRKGALFFFVLLVLTATRRRRSAREVSKTTLFSAFSPFEPLKDIFKAYNIMRRKGPISTDEREYNLQQQNN